MNYLSQTLQSSCTESKRKKEHYRLYFGRKFLRLNYINITKNTYIRSLTVMEIMARGQLKKICYAFTNYKTHIKTRRNLQFL
jgi:hypothetical protein